MAGILKPQLCNRALRAIGNIGDCIAFPLWRCGSVGYRRGRAITQILTATYILRTVCFTVGRTATGEASVDHLSDSDTIC